MVLMFMDREFRSHPRKVLDGLSQSGVLVSTLYLMFLAVTVIDVCLNFTGLAKFISVDVLSMLKAFDVSANSAGSQLLALGLTMFLAVLLGMGMPAVPAYINAALLMGPMLVGLGLATFTAHMFIFYFAVASAITPPVALAAFAASSITNADPMKTGFSAVKSGIVMFTIPFVFALYPELLLIDQAVIDPGTGAFFDGYDGIFNFSKRYPASTFTRRSKSKHNSKPCKSSLVLFRTSRSSILLGPTDCGYHDTWCHWRFWIYGNTLY